MKKNRKIFYGNMASGKSVLAKQLEDIYPGDTYYLTGDFGLQSLIKEYEEKLYDDLIDNSAYAFYINRITNMLVIEDYQDTHITEILKFFSIKNHPIIILTEKEPDLPTDLAAKVDIVKCTYELGI